ncbi:MAG: hypothetical protein KHX03_03365 [Clostridium sp.]|nr:hypothetical protein [Clostridium sp.]
MMKNIKNKLLVPLVAGFVLAGGMIAFADKVQVVEKSPSQKEVNLDLKAQAPSTTQKTVASGNYICVSPLEVVSSVDKYLNKNIKFKATFDKFSTLGLDYKPAYRDSQKYISFLIKRDDVTDHTIPLAEMKIFIKRSEAEKFIDLDSGDIIEVYGKVFSNALTDTWVDVDKLVVVEKKNKDKSKKA